MPRPTKPIHVTRINISCYQSDVDFINANRGDCTISSYLIESAYKQAGDFSRTETMINEIKELKKKNEELEKKLMFANTTIERLSKKKTTKPKPEINEALLIKFYTDKKLHDAISKFGNGVNWESLYDSNIGILSSSIGNPKELQRWCIDYYRDG